MFLFCCCICFAAEICGILNNRKHHTFSDTEHRLATILKYLCFRKYFKVVIKNNGKAIIGFQLASQSMHVAWFHSCNTIPR